MSIEPFAPVPPRLNLFEDTGAWLAHVARVEAALDRAHELELVDDLHDVEST